MQNPERVQRGLEVIVRNAKTQARLITDLLDVSRMMSGKLRLNRTKFALPDVIGGAADVVRHAAEAKGIRLVLDIDPAIGLTVGDPGRLQQVLWNLLMNAIRYTPQGGHVTVTARRNGSTNVVRVQDAGVGIPREHLPHIFEPFRQVDSSTTRAHGGLGLGLALVRHLVEAHGGTVEVHSDGPGRGATFTVSLPVIAVHLGDPEAEAGIAEEAKEETTEISTSSPLQLELAGLRLLVVEDDPDSLETVRVVLEEAGARVTTATRARDAFDAMEVRPFDAIISDIGMPDVDGYTLMRSIRSSGRTLPAVALTAYTQREDAEQAKEAGFQEHLAKPVDSWKLVETVKMLVSARSGEHHAAESQELRVNEPRAGLGATQVRRRSSR
jgi:CheY-like chemotaxis protein/two-component sensor histidine kinase